MSHLLLRLQDLLQIPNFCTLNPPLILLVISTLIVSPVFGTLSLFSPSPVFGTLSLFSPSPVFGTLSLFSPSPVFGTLSLFSPWKNRLNHLSKISRLFFGTISSPTLILILHAPFISFAPVDNALLYLYTIISLRLFDLSNRLSVTFCHCHLTVILYLPFVFVYCKAIIIIIIIIIIINTVLILNTVLIF